MSTPDDLRHQWDYGSPGTAIRVCSACKERETYWDDDEYPNNPCPVAIRAAAMRAAVADLESLTVYALSNDADCMFGNGDGPGARFLTAIRADVVDMLGDMDADEWHDAAMTEDVFGVVDDAAHEIADRAVPIYTHKVWNLFADLGAWQEDPTELGADASDMEQAAKVCIYMIGNRLAWSLFERASQTYRDEYEALTDVDED